MGRKMDALKWTGGLLAGAWGGYAAVTWCRYGKSRRTGTDGDEQLDRFLPDYEISERHSVRVAAPVEDTFAAELACDLEDSPVVRGIIRARELLLGASGGRRPSGSGLVERMRSIGWGVLAEVPGREVVMGAVTKPWEADVVFRPLPPEEFRDFREPGYVKIAWTFRADPVTEASSIALSETRATTTDSQARAKFRRYWAALSPGIKVIRWVVLPQVRREAERRFRTRGVAAIAAAH